MGIVTDICLILALLLGGSLSHTPSNRLFTWLQANKDSLLWFIGAVATWNILWYASQNLAYFWGKMSLLAGISMLLAILPLIDSHKLPASLRNTTHTLTTLLSGWRYQAVRLLLIGCIVQYSWTLVLLNING